MARRREFMTSIIFEEVENDNIFVNIRLQAMTSQEQDGIDNLFLMMLCIKQQKMLRSKLGHE